MFFGHIETTLVILILLIIAGLDTVSAVASTYSTSGLDVKTHCLPSTDIFPLNFTSSRC
jgi:hypothetical protein